MGWKEVPTPRRVTTSFHSFPLWPTFIRLRLRTVKENL